MSDSARRDSGLIVETRGHVRVLTLDRRRVRADVLPTALELAERIAANALWQALNWSGR